MDKKITIARKWLKQAKHDLEMSEKNIDIGGYDVASFLAHQSIEKLLKSVFVIQGKPLPKIHYLDELANQLNLSEEIVNNILEIASDYMFSRYPDVSDNVPYELYDKETAKTKIDFAKKIFLSLSEQIKSIEE
jgi:HEPN domain-containing protein